MSTRIDTVRSTDTALPNRVLTVIRMNSVDSVNRVGGPWLILAAIFVVNLAIWWAIRANVDDPGAGTTGALSALFIIVGSMYLVTMTQVMPFAISLGLTRRHFYLGVSVLLALETLLHAVVLTAMLGIERMTGGWGVGTNFFSMTFMPEQGPVLQVLTYWGPLLTFGFVFLALGAVFRRWGQIGIWTIALALLLVVGAIVFALTWQSAWPAFGRFFVETPVPLLLAGYPLILGAVAAVGGYLVIRRARL
ncbi:hypothetical protein WIS52_28950 [Pseudonocardia nematodicida]|uniref:ABC transporter permease n=1 Tax=Pseudonocardia nematodicida TaxID=1206997 RepID=A0ABV1KJ81_9PSEU